MSTRIFLARRAFAGVLVLLPFATSAPAVFEDGLPPTVEEAHAFLGGTFQRYQVAYGDENVRRASGAAAYAGEGCNSELVSDRRKPALLVDWSAISAVGQLEGNAVELQAASPQRNVRLYFPNQRAARSSANAFEVLRSACAQSARR